MKVGSQDTENMIREEGIREGEIEVKAQMISRILETMNITGGGKGQ